MLTTDTMSSLPLDQLLNSALTGMCVYHTVRNGGGEIVDYQMMMLNAAAITAWAVPQDELVGMRLSQLYGKGDALFLSQRFEAVVEGGCNSRFEFEYRWPSDGSTHRYAMLVTRLDGNGVIVCCDEIDTVWRQKKQANLLQSIIDHTRESVVLAKPVFGPANTIVDFRGVYANENVVHLLGYSTEQIQHENFGSLWPGWQQTDRFANYIHTWQTGEPTHLEFQQTNYAINGWFNLTASRLNEYLLFTYSDITALREAELKQRQQAQFYKAILDASPTSLVIIDPVRNKEGVITDFQFRLVNKTTERRTNLTEVELLGQSVITHFPGVVDSGMFARWVAVVETGQADQHEVHYTYDGYDTWNLHYIVPYENGLVVSSTNVDTLKEAEMSRQRQNDLLVGIVENGKAGITLFDPVRNETGQIIDFQYIFTNSVNSQNTGLTVAQMTGQRLLSLFPGMGQTEWYTRLLHTAQTGEEQSFLFDYHAEGIHGWFDTRFVKLDNQVLFTDLNVSELKNAQLVLEQVMNTTPTAIVVQESIRDSTGQIIDFRMTRVNQVAANLLGRPVDQIEHRRISQYFEGILDTPQFTAYCDVIRTGEPTRFEGQLGDGWYDFSVARLGDGIVIAAQDVTATRRYRQQLELANLELKRSNENLQSFTYVASHDLQEPLRKITSFAAILNNQYAGQLDPGVTDIIRRINGSAERMRTLIQDLLTYSQVDAPVAKSRKVNLSKLISELADNELWSALYQSKAELQVGELPVILADPFQMQQLFQNLLSNAIKFRRPDVVPGVSISAQLVARKAIAGLPAAPANDRDKEGMAGQFHEISIADNGIGFDEKYLDRMFQMFQRLHGRSTYDGSGVGLAICQKIVEKHGGVITATSQPGAGSTFRVYLPALT
jgi:signal transduction histidine kinase